MPADTFCSLHGVWFTAAEICVFVDNSHAFWHRWTIAVVSWRQSDRDWLPQRAVLLTHIALLTEFPDPGEHLFILGSGRCEVCGQKTDDGHQTAHVLQVPLVFICCQHCAHQTLKDMNGLGMKKSVCTQPCAHQTLKDMNGLGMKKSVCTQPCQHCAQQTLKEDMNGLGMKKSVCTQPCQQCPTVTDLKAAADFSLCVDVSVPHDLHSWHDVKEPNVSRIACWMDTVNPLITNSFKIKFSLWFNVSSACLPWNLILSQIHVKKKQLWCFQVHYYGGSSWNPYLKPLDVAVDVWLFIRLHCHTTKHSAH